MLRDLNLEPAYDSYLNKPLEEFLIPCLSESLIYDRAVGYFSSALLSIIPEVYTSFAERGGKIRLICSPALSWMDAKIFNEVSSSGELIGALNSDIDDLDTKENMGQPLDLMATLLKHGALEIKFAIPKDNDQGIFHQKIGLFGDGLDSVAFSGSNNETFQAWWPAKNSEKFHVFKGWTDGVSEFASGIRRDFDLMWQDKYPGFNILPFQDGLNFIKRREKDVRTLTEVKSAVREWREKNVSLPSIPDPELRDYQLEVLKNWEEKDYSGVVSFATGAGKTFTALAGISRWLKSGLGRTCLILVPSIKLQKQWLVEIEKFPSLANSPKLLVGGVAKRSDWQAALRGFTGIDLTGLGRIVISVMPTAAKPIFHNHVQWGEHLLVVADELHNIGATSRKELLAKIASAGGKLGLSATPARYEESENQRIREIFSDDLLPEIGISKAQSLGALVSYQYRYKTVGLLDDEIVEYKELSKRIGALMARLNNRGSLSQKEKQDLDQLRISRANVVKGAKAKTPIVAEILRSGSSGAFSWLVFCNDQNQMADLHDSIKGLKPLTYHQNMDGDGEATINAFAEDGGILLAIEMMDEGVDIPSIESAILMASSQNQRQYIQRLGRILRKNPSRIKRSVVWDIIVLDEDGFAINSAEITRAKNIAETATNSSIQLEIDRLARPQF